MSDNLSIKASLQQIGIPILGAIIEDTSAPDHYFVHVSVSRDARNRRRPTNKQLSEARQMLASAGFNVDFLLVDLQTQNIEAGLRATVLHKHSTLARNVYMSVRGKSAYVWLDPKRSLDQSQLAGIGDTARQYLSGFGFELGSLALTTGQDLPGVLVCLRILRLLAPADLPALVHELVRRGFNVPSEDWLQRRLDSMRRSGQLLRLGDGRYVLTMEAIRKLGTSKDRASPDLTRLLALARGGM